jgi:hypothetical protein
MCWSEVVVFEQWGECSWRKSKSEKMWTINFAVRTKQTKSESSEKLHYYYTKKKKTKKKKKQRERERVT